jgi:hypothetical protein
MRSSWEPAYFYSFIEQALFAEHPFSNPHFRHSCRLFLEQPAAPPPAQAQAQAQAQDTQAQAQDGV